MPAGRPRKIQSPAELEAKAQAYFDRCEQAGEPVLLMGLILALGLSSRQSLDEYAARPEFSDSVKRAKARVELEYEKRLASGTVQVAGAIFALKNFGWRDTQHQTVDQTQWVISSEPLSAEEWGRQYCNE